MLCGPKQEENCGPRRGFGASVCGPGPEFRKHLWTEIRKKPECPKISGRGAIASSHPPLAPDTGAWFWHEQKFAGEVYVLVSGMVPLWCASPSNALWLACILGGDGWNCFVTTRSRRMVGGGTPYIRRSHSTLCLCHTTVALAAKMLPTTYCLEGIHDPLDQFGC